MSIEFRPAVRENVPLIIGIAGSTGSGKTLSALKIARGLAGGDDTKIFAIDTESGRAGHYAVAKGEQPTADKFAFRWANLHPPFSPQSYRDAVMAADLAGAAVVVVDSMSHEWAGDGGILDWREQELEQSVERARQRAESAGWRFDEYRTRENLSVTSWIKPKGGHKRMMSALLACRPHLIFCLRAEEKMLMTSETDEKTGRKKAIIVPAHDRPISDRWQPICEKNFMYEMTVSLLMVAGQPGVPIPVKLQEQHRPMVPLDRPVSEATGAALLAWASGGAEPSARQPDPIALAEAEARKGIEALKAWWGGAGKAHQRVLKGDLDRLKKIAADADAGGMEVEEEVAFDEAGRAEADSDGDRKPPQADREGADTGGKPSGDGLSASRRDHIVKLIQAAGPDAACVDAVIRDNGPVLQELASKDYDAVMEASLERKDVLRADADRVAAE
jgi:hypothetical protein